MKYLDHRPDMRTGDLLLFSGKGPISWLIKRATRSRFSHVGMVYVMCGSVFCWESTKMTGQDGVQISLLSRRLIEYNGGVFWRALNAPHYPEVYNALAELREEVKGRCYERSILELLGAALPWRNKPDLSSLFCSELVAEAYRRMGLLGGFKPANEYTPGDFATLKLKNPYSLGDLHVLEKE